MLQRCSPRNCRQCGRVVSNPEMHEMSGGYDVVWLKSSRTVWVHAGKVRIQSIHRPAPSALGVFGSLSPISYAGRTCCTIAIAPSCLRKQLLRLSALAVQNHKSWNVRLSSIPQPWPNILHNEQPQRAVELFVCCFCRCRFNYTPQCFAHTLGSQFTDWVTKPTCAN